MNIPFYEIHVRDLFAVTCNKLFESSFFVENLSIECSVNFILRHIFKELTEEQTLLQTSRSCSSYLWWVVPSTHLTKPSCEQGNPMNQSPQPSPNPNLCRCYSFGTLTDTIYITNSRIISKFSQEFFTIHPNLLNKYECCKKTEVFSVNLSFVLKKEQPIRYVMLMKIIVFSRYSKKELLATSSILRCIQSPYTLHVARGVK
jgi:hypothetical protein